MLFISSNKFFSLNSWIERLSMFHSIFELSSMSSINESKSSTLIKMISMYHSLSLFWFKNRLRCSAHDLIAFKGVQYSWETLANKILLNETYKAAWCPLIISQLSITMTSSALSPFQGIYFFFTVKIGMNASPLTSNYESISDLISSFWIAV